MGGVQQGPGLWGLLPQPCCGANSGDGQQDRAIGWRVNLHLLLLLLQPAGLATRQLLKGGGGGGGNVVNAVSRRLLQWQAGATIDTRRYRLPNAVPPQPLFLSS